MNELVLSLFPGVGLLDRAFTEAGFCVVQAQDKITGGDIRDFAGVPGRLDGIIADPPYVLSERSHGKTYAHELTDDCHRRLLEVLTRIPATSAAVMLCGYKSKIYEPLKWFAIDHRVPTRGGLQDERIWMNYSVPAMLHDTRFLGNTRRERERIRRRQVNWLSQLNAMCDRERVAMLAVLNGNSSPGEQ